MLSVLNSLLTKEKKYTEIVIVAMDHFFVVVVVSPLPILSATLSCYVEGNISISREKVHSSYTGMTNDLDDPILK